MVAAVASSRWVIRVRAAAVAFQAGLALEGVVHRFDPLADPPDSAVPGASSRRSGRTSLMANAVVAWQARGWVSPVIPGYRCGGYCATYG
jgi:hypothetical protein